MAAYGALVSIMHIINQIEHHPRPPNSLDRQQVQSLTENVTFLQEFLEGYSHVAGYSREAGDLENRIVDAACAAEDWIEVHIVKNIKDGPTRDGIKYDSSLESDEDPDEVLEEVIKDLDSIIKDMDSIIKDMDSIKKVAMEIKEKMGVPDQRHINSSFSAGSLRSASTGQSITTVGFEDILINVMDKLIGGKPDRKTIAIVGMGGIGKTTLAREIYQNQIVVQYFDIRAWVAISQEYRLRDILLKLLQESRICSSQMDESELGLELHKSLTGRRYLIVMDDIWDIEAWNQLKLYFPDNNSGSRIILTSRQSNLGFQLSGSHCFQMNFLGDGESWKLLCQNVFGEQGCPLELKKIGKKIARSCKGLPLSIVVVGGHLAKSERAQQYWEHILENLNSIVNLEDDERCSQILYMSYNSLPVYLKPCFLYMGAFAEDSEIRASELIRLWVAEGFLKPIDRKSLEEVAEEFLEGLVDRNLILVHKRNFSGKIKLCKIHDLLRDLCLREAQKQKFLCILGPQSRTSTVRNMQRICIRQQRSGKDYWFWEFFNGLGLELCARSFFCELYEEPGSFAIDREPKDFRLLRVYSMVKHFKGCDEHYLQNIFQQVNLRYITIEGGLDPSFEFPSSASLLWNLQTLIVRCYTTKPVVAPREIWKMPQLRHVKFLRPLALPDYFPADLIVLENLQTLSDIHGFKCSGEVVKRIPNIKKLGIHYSVDVFKRFHKISGILRSPINYLHNLAHLHKLESLDCFCDPKDTRSFSVHNLTFPHSLKKLALRGTHLDWKGLKRKIGSLPLLQVPKLTKCSFTGSEWETIEGQFCSLKFLLISSCNDLKYWTTDSTHFPKLEQLVLQYCKNLEEIPACIGDIPTLQSIQLDFCSDTLVDSAKAIQEAQEELGNEGLQVSYDMI